jgi:pantetheine-phosphate adenylyltransferase
MIRALYPGSFDPVTNGHLDVLSRACRLFDEVIVAVAHNSAKTALFSPEQRMELLQAATADLPNTRIVQFEGLLVDFAKAHGARAIIRGLRAVSDFEFEFQMALMNRSLAPDLETLFLMPSEETTYLSSRLVKEVARLGGDIERFVPKCVRQALLSAFTR